MWMTKCARWSPRWGASENFPLRFRPQSPNSSYFPGMSNSPTCPRCGAPLAAGSVEGLCAKCLGALNFTASAILSAEEPVPPASPLRVEDLAPHFPQLEILECLGRGGMGVVYKARQKSLNRLVALKLLAPERAAQPGFAERFAHEARALAALSHPSIVAVHDFGQAGGFYFLLMEFVDGVNLRQAMNAKRFTPEQALAIVPPICEALQYAHEHGIVHRDIKPENLLLDREGRVKIADFGVAKMLGDDVGASVAASQPAGTPQYMAPEQKDHQRTDHRADIYSLGIVLYEMLTGERPKEKIEPPSRRVQVDVRIDEIVLRALEKAPELRFQTAADLRTQLETIAAPTRTGQDSAPEMSRLTRMIPGIAFAVIYAAYAWYLRSLSWQLPERPVSHFNMSGEANAWMNRSTYLMVSAAIPLIFVGMAWLASRSVWWWPGVVNLPRRDYWLAPERLADTAALIFHRMLWLGCLQTIFFFRIHVMVLAANRASPPHLPSGPFLVWIIAFLMMVMIWISFFIMRFAEAEHWPPPRRASGKAATGKPTAPLERFFHTMGYRHTWSQILLALSFLGFLGFIGWGWMPVFHCFFVLFFVANLVERVSSGAEAAGHPEVRNIRRRQYLAVGVILFFAVLTRVLLFGIYVVNGNSAAPEIPAGSHILVWKKARAFAAGHMVAYREGDNAYVGRVVRATPEAILVNRNGRPDETIPRSRVIGKVVSVLWRGEEKAQEGQRTESGKSDAKVMPAAAIAAPRESGLGGSGAKDFHAPC
jgi:predicted Ser/Thr protein kinase